MSQSWQGQISKEKNSYAKSEIAQVVFGGMARFSSDDLNKLIWMIRIASGVFPDMQQSDYLGPKGQVYPL